jgi:hypothetical protein
MKRTRAIRYTCELQLISRLPWVSAVAAPSARLGKPTALNITADLQHLPSIAHVADGFTVLGGQKKVRPDVGGDTVFGYSNAAVRYCAPGIPGWHQLSILGSAYPLGDGMTRSL